MRQISVVIPAAGMGRRMKSYGPKSLISLDGRQTVVERQVAILRHRYPQSEIIVVVGHEADRVMDSVVGVRFVENEHHETTNVLRSIGMGLRATSGDGVLIVYGDLVFTPSAVNIAGPRSVAVVENRGQMDGEEVGVTVVDGRITRFAYDLPTKWAQIVYLTGEELRTFRHVSRNRDYRRWYGFEGLNKVIEAGGHIRAVEPRRMKIAEIDTSRDIEKARRLIEVKR